jgi:hypothetical protein
MDSKKTVILFVSYARANQRLANRFITLFQETIKPSKTYQYVFWQDTEILVGENWHAEIQTAIDSCHLGLLLISPSFLGSQYITGKELPKFVGDQGKPVIPVMLQPVDLELHDLKGLQEKQIFRLDSERFQHPKAFGECTGNQRDRFAMALFRQVEKRLQRLQLK